MEYAKEATKLNEGVGEEWKEEYRSMVRKVQRENKNDNGFSYERWQ
jgi:hypothetical protein